MAGPGPTAARTRSCESDRGRRPGGAGRGTCRTGCSPGGRAAPSRSEMASTCPSRRAECARFPRAEPGEEFIETCLGPILTAKPDRALTDEIAHHDAVGVPLLDREFVEPEHRRAGRARAAQLLAHVLLLQRLDRVPIEAQLLGHVADRGGAAAPADVEGKALRVERVVGEELQPLPLHGIARLAGHAPDFDVEVHTRVATGEIAEAPHLAVVPLELDTAAGAARGFFDRRTSGRTRAFGSPKMPMTVGAGRNPGNRYASQRRRTGRGVGICA